MRSAMTSCTLLLLHFARFLLRPHPRAAWEDGTPGAALVREPLFRPVWDHAAVLVPVSTPGQASLAVVWLSKSIIEIYSAVEDEQIVKRHAKIAAAFIMELATTDQNPSARVPARDCGWYCRARVPVDAIDVYDQSVWIAAAVQALFEGKAMTSLTSITCGRPRVLNIEIHFVTLISSRWEAGEHFCTHSSGVYQYKSLRTRSPKVSSGQCGASV
ncbi:hypothetical protein EXIGLDRAFT_694859, partial [Exidia glandulosa HHB12029]